MSMPRVALLGFFHETNRFAPDMPDSEFRTWRGAELLEQSRTPGSAMNHYMAGFVRAMDMSGPWQPVPLTLMAAGDAGPAEQTTFDAFLAEVSADLADALPLDAVYLAQHTGGITTEDEDSDGTLFAAVRLIVGPAARIVVTSDLHGSVSERMVRSVDLLVTLLTNPHEDQAERGAEAAAALREMLGGMLPVTSFIRVPMLTWTIPQETKPGNPFGDLVIRGQALQRADPRLLNVSIFASFACTNVPKVGLSIVVTARESQVASHAAAQKLAAAAWADRHRYTPAFTTLDHAVAMASQVGVDKGRAPLLFVDFADNPGGGGGGNTVTILRAFLNAGVQGALFGLHTDPALVQDALAAGEGRRFKAVFNRAPDRFAERFVADARVIRLTDGAFVATRNPRGRALAHGPSCALDLGGVTVLLITNRAQILSTDAIEHFGLHPESFRSTVLKSRLHYKAGFRHLFPDDQIVEVDVPGQASPVLSRWTFDKLARPIFPLDAAMEWTAPA